MRAGALLVALEVLAFTVEILAGQTPQAPGSGPQAAAGARSAKPEARKAWVMPKTPWGHPDLQGVWTTDDADAWFERGLAEALHSDNAAFTGLVLAGANAPSKDGKDSILTGLDIVDLPLEKLRKELAKKQTRELEQLRRELDAQKT
jgi:hypothetical protein